MNWVCLTLVIIFIKIFIYKNFIWNMYINYVYLSENYSIFIEIIFTIQYFYGLYILFNYQLTHKKFFKKYWIWCTILNIIYVFLTVFVFSENILHINMFLIECVFFYLNILVNSISSLQLNTFSSLLAIIIAIFFFLIKINYMIFLKKYSIIFIIVIFLFLLS